MILEVAVDDPLGLAAAVAGGADRIELCSALDLGGLTPSAGLMRHAAGCGLPIMAMIRPRAGGFCLDDTDLLIMLADIATARQAGLAGVVFGALTTDLTLDLPKMSQLCAAADGMQITLHRAFDLIEDWRRALDQAVASGVNRILTSGAALSAPAGITRLAEIVDYAAGRIGILLCGNGRAIKEFEDRRIACFVQRPGYGRCQKHRFRLCQPQRTTNRRREGPRLEGRDDGALGRAILA
ncbi:MAG: hypothetical protein RL472_2126 [Pseudomonadota bacterium]